MSNNNNNINHSLHSNSSKVPKPSNKYSNNTTRFHRRYLLCKYPKTNEHFLKLKKNLSENKFILHIHSLCSVFTTQPKKHQRKLHR